MATVAYDYESLFGWDDEGLHRRAKFQRASMASSTEFWVRAETVDYALKSAWRNDFSCFRSRCDAEAMDSEDNLYRIVVDEFRKLPLPPLRPEDV